MSRYRRAKKGFVSGWACWQSCAECGESDHEVLQYDHVIPEEKHPLLKQRGKRQALTNLGWPALREEVGKLQVLCANCHIRKTRREERARAVAA